MTTTSPSPTASDVDSCDPRYTLTDFEKEEVLALKAACDREAIPYRSIFELAKYTLVSASIPNEKKRRLDSFSRIRKKHLFNQKYNLQCEEGALNILSCVKAVEKRMPEWAMACGKLDGQQVIGYSSDSVDPHFMTKVPQGFEILCKMELTRYDLGAVDLEEARNGFIIIGTGRDLSVGPISSARMASKLRVLYDKMNANRIKGIYFELPPALSVVANILMKVLPKKLKSRVSVGKKTLEVKGLKERKTEVEKVIPEKLGGDGSYEMKLVDWFTSRIQLRSNSDKLVTLE